MVETGAVEWWQREGYISGRSRFRIDVGTTDELGASGWNGRNFALVRHIPSAPPRREGRSPTRPHPVLKGKQRLTTRQHPAWRSLHMMGLNMQQNQHQAYQVAVSWVLTRLLGYPT